MKMGCQVMMCQMSGMGGPMGLAVVGWKTGAIRDFFTIASLCRELSPTSMLKWPGCNRVQIMCNTSDVITCNMPHATWYEGKAQLLSLAV